MSEYNKEMPAVRPVFDMELMLGLLQETRLGGQVMESLADAWERWLPHLRAMILTVESKQYLAIWLDEDVEREVDDTWGRSATEGFRLNALAQTMIMGAVYQIVPECGAAGGGGGGGGLRPRAQAHVRSGRRSGGRGSALSGTRRPHPVPPFQRTYPCPLPGSVRYLPPARPLSQSGGQRRILPQRGTARQYPRPGRALTHA